VETVEVTGENDKHHNRRKSAGITMQILNTKLLFHPLNWIIILLMLVIAAIFGHLLLSLLDQEPATGAPPNGLPAGYQRNQTGTNA
jgi:hypothetical protein